MNKPIITRQPDGNVFYIISAVAMALRRANQKDKELEFVKRAYESRSYEKVIQLTHDYVVWDTSTWVPHNWVSSFESDK